MKRLIFSILFSILILNLILSAPAPEVVAPGETDCDTRDDCLAAGWVEPADYCQDFSGDVVFPHLSCFMGKCEVLEGFIDEDGPYRLDCNYGGCYTADDGTPKCCTSDGCPGDGSLIPGVIGPGLGIECETRNDCFTAGMTEPEDYCDAKNGDVVRPHLGCNIDGYCELFEGFPNEESPYRLDCNYGACYLADDGTPRCCPEDGCPGLIIPGEPGAGVGGGPSVPGIIIPGLPDGSTSCENREDCIEAGWEVPNNYCDAANGDVVRPHLSCFKEKCTILEGTPNEDGPYRLDCNYGACYMDTSGVAKCCTKDGCPVPGADDGDAGDDDDGDADDDKGLGDWIENFLKNLFGFFFRK